MSNWQPIETAPKDRRILLARKKDARPAVRVDKNFSSVVEGKWDDKHQRFKAWSCYQHTGTFTHWMPLPEPPEAQP